jgi:predicted nucleotidyltransferase/DNA-binding transcriptional ArsR family regulator
LPTYDGRVKLIASEVALRVLLALSERRGMTLAQLARALQARPSSVQAALAVLAADGLVESTGAGRSRTHRLRDEPVVSPLLQLAVGTMPVADALGIVARAHPAVELAAHDEKRILVVFGSGGDPLEQSRAAAVFDHVASAHGMTVEHTDHDDARREVTADPSLRTRVAAMQIVHGSLDRTYPDRARHGDLPGAPLGRPHPGLRLPRPGALARLKRRHGLERLALFGSAVRSDFRDDSDVDVLVTFREPAAAREDSLREIERELEALTGRDVDVVEEEMLWPYVRRHVSRTAVPL